MAFIRHAALQSSWLTSTSARVIPHPGHSSPVMRWITHGIPCSACLSRSIPSPKNSALLANTASASPAHRPLSVSASERFRRPSDRRVDLVDNAIDLELMNAVRDDPNAEERRDHTEDRKTFGDVQAASLLDLVDGSTHLVLVVEVVQAKGDEDQQEPEPERKLVAIEQVVARLQLTIIPIEVEEKTGEQRQEQVERDTRVMLPVVAPKVALVAGFLGHALWSPWVRESCG